MLKRQNEIQKGFGRQSPRPLRASGDASTGIKAISYGETVTSVAAALGVNIRTVFC